MALTTYAESTNTEPGTDGALVRDLSLSQGIGSITSENVNSTSFTEAQRWQRTIDTGDYADGSSTWPFRLTAASFNGTVRFRFRLQRRNSSDAVQSSSGWSSEYTTVGTKSESLTWDCGTWAAGDRLCLQLEILREGGHGNVSLVTALGATDITAPEGVAPVFEQTGHRFRPSDEDPAANANGAGDWEAARDTNVSLVPDQIFGARFEVEVDIATTQGFKIFGQKNGSGGFVELPTNDSPFIGLNNQYEIMVVPGSYTDGAATTELLAGDQTFFAGNHNDDNQTAAIVFPGLRQTEIEFRLVIRKLARNIANTANVHNADTDYWELRVYKDNDTALDTYPGTDARVTVLNNPGHIGGASPETQGRGLVPDDDGNIYVLTEYADTPTSAAVGVMMKSTDEGESWNPVGTASANLDDLEAIDMHYVPEDDTIYIGTQLNADARFFSFRTAGHASPDSWNLDELVEGSAAPDDQIVGMHWRADNTAVLFYHDNSGTADSDGRIRYRIRTVGGSWVTNGEMTVDSEASHHFTGLRTVMDPADDTIHIFYLGADGTNGEIWHRTLNSSDTLSGRTQVDQAITPTNGRPAGNLVNPIAGAVIWDDGGTVRVGLAYYDETTDDLYWNDSPVSGGFDFTANEASAVTDVETNALGGKTVSGGVAVDDVDDVPYVMGTDASTSLAYMKYDSRVSGTWQGDTNWSTSRHKMPRPKVFTHVSSGNRVLGFTHSDKRTIGDYDLGSGGTGFFRYDEIVIAEGGSVYPPFPRRPNAPVRM